MAGIKEIASGRLDIFKVDPKILQEEPGFNLRTEGPDLDEYVNELADVDREKLIKAMTDNLRSIWHREYGGPITNPDGIEIVGAEDAADEILVMIEKEAHIMNTITAKGKSGIQIDSPKFPPLGICKP